MNWTKAISAITAILVFLLFVASFILSYSALRGIASAGIVPQWQWLWPLVIDGAIVVFALVVVYFGLINHNYVVPEVLVIVFTVFTVLFNAIHAGDNGVSVAVAIMPPVALFLSFKMLMWIIKNAIERTEVNHSLDNLKKQWTTEQTTIENEKGKLNRQLDNLNEQIERAKQTLQQAKGEQKKIDKGTIFQWLPDNLPVEVRQQIVKNMSNDGITIGQQASYLRVSEGTIKNDRRAIFGDNGKH